MWKTTSPTTFQDFNDYCKKMQIDETLTIKDSRDQHEVSVRKLLDGKCYTADNYFVSQRVDWQTAMSSCPDGWRIPTLNEYNNVYNLYHALGNHDLNNKTGWCIRHLWTSTTSGSSAYVFYLSCDGTKQESLNNKTGNNHYNCVANQS